MLIGALMVVTALCWLVIRSNYQKRCKYGTLDQVLQLPPTLRDLPPEDSEAIVKEYSHPVMRSLEEIKLFDTTLAENSVDDPTKTKHHHHKSSDATGTAVPDPLV